VVLGAAATAAASIGSIPLWFAPLMVGIYVDELGLSLIAAGGLLTLELVALAFATFDTRLFSRLPIRRVALSAAIVAAVANYMTFLEQSLEVLVLCRLIAGAAAGILYRVMTIAVAESNHREVLYGVVVAVASLVCAIALGLLSFLATKVLNGAPFLVQAGLFAILLPLLFGFGSGAVSAPRLAVQVIPHGVRWLVCGNLLLWLSVGAFWSVAERLAVSHNISKDLMYLAFSMSSVASIGGAVLATMLANRLPTFAATIVGLSVYIGSIIACLADDSGWVYAASIILFNASLMFVLPFLLGRAASIEAGGRVAAALAATMMLGQAVGPMIGVTTLSLDPIFLGSASVTAAFVGTVSIVLGLSICTRRTDQGA
jgi:hypothetical protein